MKTRKMMIIISVVAMTGVITHAALTKPTGLNVIKSWNFDGDGALGGTVDSGASGTDWVNNSADSVLAEIDSTFGPAYTNANKDTNLFVDTTAGTLTYQAPVIGQESRFKFDLGGDMSAGWLDMRAMAEQTSGSSTFSAKVRFLNGGTTVAELNMRRNNALRWTVEGAADNAFASETVNAFNGYQVAWENGQISLFWDDEANGGANATTKAPVAITQDINAIQFTVTTSGTAGKGTLDSLNIEAIPEPATLGLVGIFSGALLFLRRRFMMD